VEVASGEEAVPLRRRELAECGAYQRLEVVAIRVLYLRSERAIRGQLCVDLERAHGRLGRIGGRGHDLRGASGRDDESLLVTQNQREIIEIGDFGGGVEPKCVLAFRDVSDHVIELRRRGDVGIETVGGADEHGISLYTGGLQ